MFKRDILQKSEPADLLAEKLNSRIGEFDILSLLRYLKYKGYQEGNIRFTSYQSMVSQTKLIQRVKVYEKHVVVIINLGLLGIQTSLPTSMLEEIADRNKNTYNDTDRLLKLLDHALILNFIASVYPEISNNFFSQWEKTRRNILTLQNIHSVAFLFWLFQRVFPEFVISFDEKSVPTKVATQHVTLDHNGLDGIARLGGLALLSDLCIHIHLTLEMEHYRSRTVWVTEVEERLKNFVYPLLDNREIYLFISLAHDFESNVRLAKDSRLGRDLLPSNNPEAPESMVHYFILHQGGIDIPDLDPEYIIEWGGACRIRV